MSTRDCVASVAAYLQEPTDKCYLYFGRGRGRGRGTYDNFTYIFNQYKIIINSSAPTHTRLQYNKNNVI